MGSRERNPWRKLLREDLALPSGVRGPRDLAPFRREAWICFSVRIGCDLVIARGERSGAGIWGLVVEGVKEISWELRGTA
jgi:hypothetical protein